jgi:hypothetical protein
LRGAERDECFDETPLEGVFELAFEFGSDVRWSVSSVGGCGDLDICDSEREDGKEERDVLRLTALLLELEVPFVEGRVTG